MSNSKSTQNHCVKMWKHHTQRKKTKKNIRKKKRKENRFKDSIKPPYPACQAHRTTQDTHEHNLVKHDIAMIIAQELVAILHCFLRGLAKYFLGGQSSVRGRTPKNYTSLINY